MSKQKILIISHAMELGGAETALLGLLESIDTSRYEVDLFLLRHQGPLMQAIPPEIHLLPEQKAYASLAVPAREALRNGQPAVLAGRFAGKVLAKRRAKRLHLSGESGIGLEYSHKYTVGLMPRISAQVYDLVVSFLTPHYFAAKKATGKEKIAWIHTDYSAVSVDAASELRMWAQYDRIASISPQVTKSFLQTFPSLADRMVEIENIMPTAYIQSLVKAAPPVGMTSGKGFSLLSVGRFTSAKNFDNVPEICRLLRADGLDVTWYLIGYGGDEALIRQKIQESGMEPYVKLLGKKENPYPYIQACDVYVQPSRYEGKCVAVREAQMLGKPVIITNYPTSGSQLEDGVDGLIVPLDNEGCASGIAHLLRDPMKMSQLSYVCKKRDYSNREEIKKLYQLVR